MKLKPNTIRFPRLYEAAVRNLQVDLLPSHFFDLLVLAFVFAAFAASVVTMGGVPQNDSVLAPRLLAAAAGLHAYSLVTRASTGLRLRWIGLLFLPFALWLFLDSACLSPAAWRGREQACVALSAALTFWVTLHHLRHRTHKWFLLGPVGLVAALFGGLVIGGGQNLLPRMANRIAADVYEGQATGPFGTPGEFGAFLLIALFPAGAVLCSPSLRHRRRVAAGLAVLLGFIGLWSAHHLPSWYGLLAGGALLAFLLLESRRIACVVAVACFGFGFFAQKIARLDAGLFRTLDSKAVEETARTPLPAAAEALFRAHPACGVGSGGFPLGFESVRPAGWSYDPLTAGGFFHQLAAENGLVGIALLAVPGLVLWFLGLRLCSKEPMRLLRQDRQFDKKKKSYVPERRVALAGLLAGTLAATVPLALDYARPSVTLAIVFAVCAAIVARELFEDKLNTTFAPVPRPNLRLRGAFAAVPVAAFALIVFPVFESADRARRAEDFLRIAELPATPTGDGRDQLLSMGSRRALLDAAQVAASDALRTRPDNARAAAVFSEILAAKYRLTGIPLGLGLCRRYAETAAECSREPALNLALIAVYGIYGENDKADAHLAKLRAIAPNNIPLELEQARRAIAAGDTAKARPLIDEILRNEPYNREARRLRDLASMSSAPAAP